MLNNFKNAKVGDKVFCLLNGTGRITKMDRTFTYSIGVTFTRRSNSSYASYTDMGYLHLNERTPMLYRKRPVIMSKKRLNAIVKRATDRLEYKMELERRGVELYKMTYAAGGGLVFNNVPQPETPNTGYSYSDLSRRFENGEPLKPGIDCALSDAQAHEAEPEGSTVISRHYLNKKYLQDLREAFKNAVPPERRIDYGLGSWAHEVKSSTHPSEATEEESKGAAAVSPTDAEQAAYAKDMDARAANFHEHIREVFKRIGNNDTPIEPGVL